MGSAVYETLLSVQRCLANTVTPELRAVTIALDEKNYEFFPRFFCDGKITPELADHYSIVITEIDTCTKQICFCHDEISQLDFPELIPIFGRLAFLRYEPNLPKLRKENRAFLLKQGFLPQAVFLLDMQEALLGKVTPSLRYVGVKIEPEQKKLIADFIYDGEISERDYSLAKAAVEESRISFPDYEMDALIKRVDFPYKIVHRADRLAYWRQEWEYIDGQKIPTIKNL